MEKLSKKLLASSCLFCANSSTSVRKFKITEDYGGGNTIRYDLTSFLGHQIEPYLKDDDLLCSNCMNFFENMAYTKRRLIDFLRNRDESEDIKMQGFNDIWKGFKKFAVNLVKFNPNESEENWDSPEVCGRSLTPNPLVHTYSEPYNPSYEKEFSEIERARCKSVVSYWDGNSETDLEVKRLFSRRGRRKKRGHNWTRRRGEQKSRALSRTYPAIYDNYERNCYSTMTTMSRASSDKSANSTKTTMSRRKRKLVEGKPVRTRSVSRLENYLANVTAEKESNKYYCEEINCSLFFEKLENFVLHKRYDHNIIARFPCQQCRFKGTTRQELELHHTKLHDKETILCFQCRAEIQGTYNLQEHLRQHQEYSIGCKFCYLNFLSKADLVEHVSKDHQGKRKKVREKPSFVLQTVVNKEKVLREQEKKDNNNSVSNKHKEFKCIVLNVEKSPSPEPSSQNIGPPDFSSTPVTNSDKPMSFTVINVDTLPLTSIDDEVTHKEFLEPRNVSVSPELFSTDSESVQMEENCELSGKDLTSLELNLQLTRLVPVVVLERLDFEKSKSNS